MLGALSALFQDDSLIEMIESLKITKDLCVETLKIWKITYMEESEDPYFKIIKLLKIACLGVFFLLMVIPCLAYAYKGKSCNL